MGEVSQLWYRFTYLADSEELHVMSPSQIHESSLIHLSTILNRFIGNICAPPGILSVELNSKINQPTPVIPDFLATLMHKPGDYAVKWVGEVAFTVSPAATLQKVKNFLTNSTTIDLAFIIYISEDRKWALPNEQDTKAIQLRSGGQMTRAKFLAPFLADEFYRKVEVAGLTWASLGKISFDVFLRHQTDGFDLDSTDPSYAARGVRGSLCLVFSY